MSRISTNQLAVYAVDQIEKGMSSHAIAQRVAATLINSRQSRQVTQVIRAIETELNRRGRTQVEIMSAREVSQSVKEELAALLDAERPVFSVTINPHVIGGVKARSGEKEIDLTVRGKLSALKSKIVNQE